MYSPRLFRELVLPRVRQVSELCHRQGVYHLFASDGNLWPVAEDLFGRSGLDGYFEIDRRAGMDLGTLRERFPRLTLIGNISSHTAHRGSRQEVIEETLSCLEEAKRRRGIIVGVSNCLVPGTPVENVVAILETIREFR
jgi:uroporphyrinogen decarboxylase